MTYSIVARDPKTGELGVAVQSHYFQVGPVVPWAQSGVGAIATQSMVNVSYGPIGLEMLRNGFSAEQTLKALTSGDAMPEVRQAAIVDAQGRVAAHTGTRCIPAAGHRTGDGYSCQANLMERDTVWDAMAEAYEGATGSLAERMMIALEAAEAEGGDIRGKQSAAMLVVRATSTGKHWEDRIVDLRVEDHPEPLPELRRLFTIRRAYDADTEADHLDEAGDSAAAKAKRVEAFRIAPDNVELRFWAGVALSQAGEVAEGAKLVAEAIAFDRRWDVLIDRLVQSERMTAPQAQALRAMLAAQAK
ncbi:MAG TPA: DUF1028 domain-containing protein [Candidatus Dormibacteraeota bacterium]|nr:DUF1028 domain-containing protein [Candidatus Dormibacteraeota bacterium]